MNTILNEAKAIQQELVQNRRYLHQIPELGYNLPKTTQFVKEKLIEYGYTPTEIYQSCIVTTLGDPSKGKTILLRADMDALPMKEESGLDFAATGNTCHSCGHDLHMAMLLGAAKLLKQHENELNGCVKFMFQPDEEAQSGEDIGGALRMVNHGVLENPKVDACFSMHIWSGLYKSGIISYKQRGFMCSCDLVNITIKGKASHGSRPEDAISPINIGCHIYLALQQLIAREIPSYEQAVVTLGSFNSGSTCNQIPNSAILGATLRCASEPIRLFLQKRITEVVEETAKIYGGEASVLFYSGVPSVYNDPSFTKQVISINKKMLGNECFKEETYAHASGEDISIISQLCPTCFVFLCCGDPSEGYIHSHHHPAIRFNEDVLYKGSAMFVNTAIEWLKMNQN